MRCSLPLYLLYTTCRTEQSQSSPSSRYRFITFLNQFFLISYPSALFPFLLFYFPSFPSIPTNSVTGSTNALASDTIHEVRRILLVHFAVKIDMIEFRVQINIGWLCIKTFLRRIVFSNTVPAMKIANVMRAKFSAPFKAFDASNVRKFSCSNFQEISTGQVCQKLQVSLKVATYAGKGSRKREFFCTLFRARQSFMALIKLGKFLRTAHNPSRRNSVVLY